MKLIENFFSNQFAVPDFLSQKYIPSLDGFRALSILIVVIAHLNFNTGVYIIPNIVGGGVLGVQFFFVISGLLITTLLIREKLKKQKIDLKGFYIRRAFRILPVAYAYVIAVIGLNYYFNMDIKPSFFVHQFTFTENFNKGFKWQTKHYWSLSIEEQFYLIFPFVLNKSFRIYVTMLLITIIAGPVILVLIHHFQKHNLDVPWVLDFLYDFVGSGLSSIVIGSLTAILLCKFPLNLKLNRYFILPVQLLLFVAIWFFCFHPLAGGINTTIMAVLIAALIVSTIYFTDSALYKFLNFGFIKKLGTLSYSIYIWQQIFVYNQPWQNTFSYSQSLWLNMFVLGIVAYLSYNYFEKPFLKLKAKFV